MRILFTLRARGVRVFLSPKSSIQRGVTDVLDGVKILLKLLLVQDVLEFFLLLVQEVVCARVCLSLSASAFCVCFSSSNSS